MNRRLLFIDSSKATKFSTHDNYEISFNSGFISYDPKTEDLLMYPVEFSCRRDFYSVNENNNGYSIYYNGQEHFNSLSVGFPSVLSVDNELLTDLKGNFPSANWLIEYDEYKGKINIQGDFGSNTPPADLSLNLNISNSAYEILGFGKGVYPFSKSGNIVNLASSGVVNMRGETDLYIRTSINSNNAENLQSGVRGTDTLFKVPIVVSPLNVIGFTDNNKTFLTKVNALEINNLRIRITDENNNLIGLQSNSQMVLAFEVVKKEGLFENKALDILNKIFDFFQIKELKKSIQ